MNAFLLLTLIGYVFANTYPLFTIRDEDLMDSFITGGLYSAPREDLSKVRIYWDSWNAALDEKMNNTGGILSYFQPRSRMANQMAANVGLMDDNTALEISQNNVTQFSPYETLVHYVQNPTALWKGEDVRCAVGVSAVVNGDRISFRTWEITGTKGHCALNIDSIANDEKLSGFGWKKAYFG